MEIKRRLNAIAKDLTPEIESLNISQEMLQMCKRFEELVAYGHEKVARAQHVRNGGESMSARVNREIRETREHIQKIHDEEAEEMMRDRQQHKAQPDVEPVDAG